MICVPGLARTTTSYLLPIRSSRLAVSYMYRGMYSSSNRLCRYQDWWDKRTPRASRDSSRRPGRDGVIIPPLLSFSPTIDFDPSLFTLPPAYHEVVDLEKATYLARPRSRRFSNASTLCPDLASTRHLQPKIKAVQTSYHPPIRPHIRIIRCLRYSIFTVYRRLFTFVFVLNAIGVVIVLQRNRFPREALFCGTLAAFASSNFLLAMLVRQDYLVNLLFRTAWLVPWSSPLWVRKIAARVYCYGGIHSGAAVVGTVWWIMFTVLVSWRLIQDAHFLSISIVAWCLLFLLAAILFLSYPTMRARYHNSFEMTHRFLGWLSIALFWVQLVLLNLYHSSPTRTVGTLLLHDPTFWNLTIITLLLIYPWLRLRRWTFTAHVLSSHAIRLSFPNAVHKFSCLSISSSPLREWHPFATFPSTDPDAPGASMVISNAGDWTREVIQRAQRGEKEGTVQMSFYIKSHPKAGVLSLSLLFPRVIILTTGSGIGPTLSSLLDRPAAQHARLIWSTRSPSATYGADIMELVHKADPHAVVLDTDEMGRPDLLQVCWDLYKKERADAVFVLSNEKVVKWVVGGLEKRGVPAYGPIWDS
jgi:hypothetical protein